MPGEQSEKILCAKESQESCQAGRRGGRQENGETARKVERTREEGGSENEGMERETKNQERDEMERKEARIQSTKGRDGRQERKGKNGKMKTNRQEGERESETER